MRDKTSLSERGYGLPICRFSEEEIKQIRKELTVEPSMNFGAMQQSSCSSKRFELFTESRSKIYVPKYYGLEKYGLPEEENVLKGDDISLPFSGKLRDEQEKPVECFLEACRNPLKRGGIINLSCAGGKCLGKDTPIIMFDGTLKNVQDVKVGDQLMGDDGKARNVLSVCTGRDVMYKVIPLDESFDTYTINSAHILSLYSLESMRKFDLPVLDYLTLLNYYQACGEPNPFVGYTFSPYFGRREEEKRDNKCAEVQGVQGVQGSQGIQNPIFLRMCGYKMKCHDKDPSLPETFPPQESHFYSFKVEKCHGISEYFGFEIDGNRRFLLGDCTVTHNTVIGLHVLSVLAKKTLIIVHKNFLLEQWKDRISQFLPSARVGTVKAQIIDVKDKDIVIASLQSLSMKSYDPDLFRDIGFVIVDEIHRTGTEVFSKALQKVNFKYSLGLTATLDRKDGLSKVFIWYIGDVVYKNKSRIDRVCVKCLPYFDPSPTYSKEERMFNQKLNTSKMITHITEFEPRTVFFVDAILEQMNASSFKRRCLILSDRKNHLTSIEKVLNERIPALSVGYYIGGMKDKDLKESEDKDVILATYSFASEGFDVPGLDTLILASPKSNMEQIVGRILREKEECRKNVPLVLDIIDDFSFFKNQAVKRKRYYKRMKYELT